MTIWDILIWGGSALTLLGVVALFWCILTVIRVRKSGVDDAQMRAVMQRAMAINLGALAASVIGLMLVVLGIMLGK